MRTIILVAAIAALAAPAFAAGSWTAVPVQPSTKSSFAGSGVIWSCAANGCHATSDTSTADELSECKALARQLGPLSAFAGRAAPFAEARLAACNAAATKSKH